MDLMINANIETKIYDIRGQKVMLDSDLAKLYEVETKRINEAVKNNVDKFPYDFYFELTEEEFMNLRSKFSTTNFSMTRTLPKVFTEQGVYMLATILKSKIATNVTLNIIRTFARLREFAINYKDIVDKLNKIEKTMKIDQQQTNYNTQRIDEAFELLHQILRDTQEQNNNLIGFRPN